MTCEFCGKVNSGIYGFACESCWRQMRLDPDVFEARMLALGVTVERQDPHAAITTNNTLTVYSDPYKVVK